MSFDKQLQTAEISRAFDWEEDRAGVLRTWLPLRTLLPLCPLPSLTVPEDICSSRVQMKYFGDTTLSFLHGTMPTKPHYSPLTHKENAHMSQANEDPFSFCF